MVGPGRLELPTSRLSGVRSNHLSYGPQASAWTGTILTFQKLRYLETFEDGVNSGLAGTHDVALNLDNGSTIGKFNGLRPSLVKKEKRRRRSSAFSLSTRID
jgi:hypothetical protein